MTVSKVFDQRRMHHCSGALNVFRGSPRCLLNNGITTKVTGWALSYSSGNSLLTKGQSILHDQSIFLTDKLANTKSICVLYNTRKQRISSLAQDKVSSRKQTSSCIPSYSSCPLYLSFILTFQFCVKVLTRVGKDASPSSGTPSYRIREAP